MSANITTPTGRGAGSMSVGSGTAARHPLSSAITRIGGKIVRFMQT